MSDHSFSATNLAFYANFLQDTYVAAGTWPADAVEITDDIWLNFIGVPPTGKVLGALFNSPVWLDVPALTIQQQAAQVLLLPVVTVVSSSQPDLDGEYAADTASFAAMVAIVAGISAGMGLPSGLPTFNYPDDEGSNHDWDAVQFVSFTTQVMSYIYNLGQVSIGIGAALPVNTITI
jgi:hypothetical protein